MVLFNGREFAQKKEEELKERTLRLKEKGITPRFTAILVGEDPASVLYVNLKQKAAERIGIEFKILRLSEQDKEKVIQLIESLNGDPDLQGVMVQLPLPGELDTKETTKEILNHINPLKDVDGQIENSPFVSATVKAVMYAIKGAMSRFQVPGSSQNSNGKWKIENGNLTICVVGATGAVGSGVVKEINRLSETISILECNSKTTQDELKERCLQADVIITCSGIPGIIKKDMVKQDAAIIDVGSPKPEVEEDVRDVASFVTPVPGGIGPMTVVCLMENIIEASEKNDKNSPR